MVRNFVHAPHRVRTAVCNMVVSKTMPTRYKKGRAEVPRYVKFNFTFPYFKYFLKDGYAKAPIEDFVFHNMTLEKAFRLALKMEAEKHPLFIEVAKWKGYRVDEEASA